jgi:predicted ribonuclease YlaK
MSRAKSRRDKQHEIAYSIPTARSEADIREIVPMNDNQREALHYLQHKTLTILSGPPGTAKTLLSIFAACEKLQRREVEKIYYVKPIVDTPGEKGIGFLPVTANEKLEPHMAPVRDSLNVFMAKGNDD